MTDFDWRTEDEEDWPVEAVEIGRPRRRSSWLYPLLILVVLGLTAGGLYSLFNRRAEEAEATLKEDIRRTHALVMEAADRGDDELFTTFLSGADARWLDLQREAVKRGRFDESLWMGFHLDERPFQVDEITLSPTLDEATVIYTRWYKNEEQAGEVIAFQQVAVYRRGEDRWLLAQPSPDFWGQSTTFRGGALTVVYPQRDEDQVLRLVGDLKDSLPEICAGLLIRSCPTGWQIHLELSTDPETKLLPAGMEGSIDDLFLTLPAPTLLGVPLDGVGYTAMFESYHRLLRRELANTVTRLLADRPELIPPSFEILLPTGETVSLLSPGSLEIQSLEGEIIGLFDAAQTVELPAAELTFACSAGGMERGDWNVFRYSLQTGDWNVVFQRTYEDFDNGFVVPLPGGDSYIIQEYLRDELVTARLLLWEAGKTILLREQTVNFDNALTAPFFLGQTDPTGRHLVIGLSVNQNTTWHLLDRQMCEDAAGCTLQPVLGVPIWSPDGEQMLLQEPVMDSSSQVYGMLYRAGAGGQNPIEVGEGASPFWLDETTYGYSRLNDDGRVELVLTNIGDDVPEVWLETVDLMLLAPETRNWRQMTIWNVWANPADPGMAVLMTTPDDQQNTGPYDFFLVQNRPAGEGEQQVEWLFSNDFPASSGISPFSPDGRYLFFSQRGAPIFFQELESRQVTPFDFSLGFFVDWSPDGRYYVQWADEALTLTSPSTGQRARISYDFSSCTGLQWLEN